MGSRSLTRPSTRGLKALSPTRTRLLLRDLACAAAFSSMAISGQLPLWAIGVFGLGLILAVTDRRLLSSRAKSAAAVLLLGAVALYLQVAAGGLDLVIAACSFAGLISVHRILSEPSPTTDGQTHLTSVLMVAGGAALSGDLLYAVFLFAFAIAASMSLAMGVVADGLLPEDPFPRRPVRRQVWGGILLAFAFTVAFFALFPRLSWNFASRKTAPGLGTPTSGFSDAVRLGGDGTIKTNPRVVLRAKISPDPGVESLGAYWVGRIYDQFDGHEWKGLGRPRRPQRQIHLAESAPELIHQEIELLPAYGSRTLVALEMPVLLGNATGHLTGTNMRVPIQELHGEEVRLTQPAIGYSYHAYSRTGDVAAPSPSDELDRHLGLPESLDPRVPELAARIIGTETDPLRAAEKVKQHLQQNYQYTLELPGAQPDPLADFLFGRREGHCEHFATALVVLLRTQGIPARVASGFFGGQRVGELYVVRAGDAHAWGQVLVPGRGFVTVDATPESARLGQPMPLLAWLSEQYDALDQLWRQRVLDYSFRDQRMLARELSRPKLLPGASLSPRWRTAFGVILALAALAFSVRALLGRRKGTAADEATELLDATEKLLAKVQVRPTPGEGIEELTRTLAERRHPLHVPVARVTRRYLEARFGHAPLLEGERDALVGQLARAVARLHDHAR